MSIRLDGDICVLFLLLFDLEQQCAIDVREDTTERDGCADESVQFFVTSDRELQVSRRDALDLEVLGRVTREFEDFGSQVFEDGSHVDCGIGGDAHLALRARFEETLYTTARKLRRVSVVALVDLRAVQTRATRAQSKKCDLLVDRPWPKRTSVPGRHRHLPCLQSYHQSYLLRVSERTFAASDEADAPFPPAIMKSLRGPYRLSVVPPARDEWIGLDVAVLDRFNIEREWEESRMVSRWHGLDGSSGKVAKRDETYLGCCGERMQARPGEPGEREDGLLRRRAPGVRRKMSDASVGHPTGRLPRPKLKVHTRAQ